MGKVLGFIFILVLIPILGLLCLGAFLFLIWMLNDLDGTWAEWIGGRKT
jgi:nitrate reductase NapE component